MEKYNHTLDLVKGFLMLLVVIGHVIPQSLTLYTIASFHMPVFLFISGYLIKDMDTLEGFKRKAKRLLIPLATATALYVPWWSHLGFKYTTDEIIKIFVEPRYHLWFLFVLFFQVVMVYLTEKFQAWKISISLATIFFFTSFLFPAYTYFHPRLVLGWFGLILLGYMYRHNKFNLKDRLVNYYIPFLAIGIGLFLFRVYLDSLFPYFPMIGGSNTYSTLTFELIRLLNLFLGLGVVGLSIKHPDMKFKIFNYLGKKSLIIYLYHIFFIDVVRKTGFRSNAVIIVLSILLPLGLDFALNRFKYYNFFVLGRGSIFGTNNTLVKAKPSA